jgi:hypothetical protein
MTALPQPDVAEDGFVNPDPHEPLVDARIRPLLERYAALVAGELVDAGEALVELRLPNAERRWFRNRSQLRIAFTLDALEREPDAEIAVVGSAFVDQLVTAIRSRGYRSFHGRLRPEQPPGAGEASLSVPITNATAGAPQVDVAWHKVVRLLARVVVRAGSEVEEHLVESNFLGDRHFHPRGDRHPMCCSVCDCCRRRAIGELGFAARRGAADRRPHRHSLGGPSCRSRAQGNAPP